MKPIYLLFISSCLLLTSCKKDNDSQTQLTNKPPVAKAGTDQTIYLPADSVLLDGSASFDPDGSIKEWTWTKMDGPSSFTISSPHSAKTVVKNLEEGIYHFQLMVKDEGGFFAKATVKVLVNASGGQLAFWTNEGVTCLCTGDPIDITINNTTQTLTTYFYGPPVTTCNDYRAIRFKLEPGIYYWLAVRGTDTASGTINIGINTCFVQEVKF